MMLQAWMDALIGGVIIGAAVSIMLLINGRVTGISGIINGAISPQKGDMAWRWMFIAGLWFGGLSLYSLNPAAIGAPVMKSSFMTIVAGLLVGFGTVMGSGCTSGHGICGISRLSPRSLIATISFMLAGIASVALLRHMGMAI